jgi:hypothetical protein
MMRSSAAALAFLLNAAALGAAPAPAHAGPVLVAAGRCNSQMINGYESEIRDDDAHPPRGNPDDLQKRFNDIGALLQSLGQERGIVDSVCSSDAEKAPLFAQIGAAASWALALQSDLALRMNVPCAPAAKAIGQALLAQGWLDLASVVNQGGAIPPDVTSAAPRIQTRAAALGLTLPVYADTSAYWRTQITNQAKAAAAACPSPAATGSPAPSSSP